MIHAYNKEYVSDAMENLGEAFDYAVHAQNLDLNRFSSLFVNASASKSIEKGNPKYISGMSGTELALTVLSQNGIEAKPVKSLVNYEKSSEYWSGWILAYYQWYSGKSFGTILKYLPAEKINRMYNPLHEAPEQKFVEIANKIISENERKSKLQELRKLAGLTQKELSVRSGVTSGSLSFTACHLVGLPELSTSVILTICPKRKRSTP